MCTNALNDGSKLENLDIAIEERTDRMSAESKRPNLDDIEEALSLATSVQYGDLDVETICDKYREEGYEVTSHLHDFLEQYREITISWLYRGRSETELEISIEGALNEHPLRIAYYSKIAGKELLPVGMAFGDTTVLLSDDSDIFFGDVAGVQRVSHGFLPSMTALIADDWDKAYLIEG
ncbi:SUKH-3 domain-containing protein [Streptomyces sp. 3211]|uniref:SUKH-3 domain-containing protein n=1 Tax=Streptomyces sp. 3211 TaxID=1964449 RepID=UPI0009A533FC|nr:SUKH-3 domain-containing protein [Streptomyces sp. 3211]